MDTEFFDFKTILIILISLSALFFYRKGLKTVFFITKLWFNNKKSGLEISFKDILFMEMTNIPTEFIINNYTIVKKAGLQVEITELQEHYLATGNIPVVIEALILSKKEGIKLSFRQAAAIDLAGSDILEAVRISSIPVIISTDILTIQLEDGTSLMIKANIKVKAKIDMLIGGAREETLLAKIEVAITRELKMLNSYDKVLKNKSKIVKTLLEEKLDFETAFAILSIEIIDIENKKK